MSKEAAGSTIADYTIDSVAWGAFTLTAVIQATTASSIITALIGATPAALGAYIWIRHAKDRQDFEAEELANRRHRDDLTHEREMRKIELEHVREMRKIELMSHCQPAEGAAENESGSPEPSKNCGA